MVERETELSNYSSLMQRREDEAIYCDIRQNDIIQNTNDQPPKIFMCNSKIKFSLLILGMVVLAVSSSMITVIILKQNTDSLRDEIIWIKLNISKYLDSNKPVVDQVPMVYFLMNRPKEQLVSRKITFANTVANVGDGYNKTTGEFVCPVPGLYHFYFSFMQKSLTNVYCYIKQNEQLLSKAETYSNNTWSAASTSAYVKLAKWDVVTVTKCTNWQYVSKYGNEGVFTGSLIHL